MLNASIIGNLGTDATIEQNQNGRYLKMRVAHSRKYVDKDGVVNNETTWVSCMWSRYSEAVLPYLKSGQKIFCEGPLSSRVYVGSDGHHHAGLTIQVVHLELCGQAAKGDES